MNPVWVENQRYWHCWLCKLYYAGRNDELKIVDDPYKNLNKPKPIDKDDLVDGNPNPIDSVQS